MNDCAQGAGALSDISTEVLITLPDRYVGGRSGKGELVQYIQQRIVEAIEKERQRRLN
jgi:hypothetical protein